MENTSTAADRISELPDEILHCILSRIKPQRKAAQTVTLSRRWRSLWRSYPVVDFSFYDVLQTKKFQKFCEATIKRFSLDRFLGMKTLELHLRGVDVKLCFPVFKQLLDLSSERKAEEIHLSSHRETSITFQLLSNSATKIMTVADVQFAYNNDLALSLNSLRFLHLGFVSFEDDRILGNVLASSPLLETLKIDCLYTTELKVSTHHTNLKTLRIASCGFRKIEIAFPGLQTLRLKELLGLSKFELTAPQLNLLEIADCKNCCFDTVISKLQYLKTLTLKDAKHGKKLKLSNPKLEELMLWGYGGLEEIEITVPGLQTLHLQGLHDLSMFELTSPHLNLLKITDCTECCFDAVISKLQYLKTLTLDGAKLGKKLKLSNPKLEELVLWGRRGLEEIAIDAGASLVKFVLKLHHDINSLDEIKKFQISNVRLDEEVDVSLEIRIPQKVTHQWCVALKRLLIRLTNFSTVNIIANKFFYFQAEFKEDDHSMPSPVDIKHLTIQIDEFSTTLHSTLLGGLFRALRPRYLTIMQDDCDNYEMLVLNFLNLMKKDRHKDRHEELFQEREYNMRHNWRDQLKDVKIVTRVDDRATRKWVTTVSFMLTWN
ncbi:F-box/FBD/LRR-repeat protein At2g04230 [Linum grandiflorum]